LKDIYIIDTKNRAQDAFAGFKVKSEDDDGKISSKPIFDKWFYMINRTTYPRIEWVPWTISKPPWGISGLNTFTSFNHLFDPEFKVDENKIKPWVFHLENVICNEDKIVSEYILNWLAHVVQKPYQKIGVNVVAKSVLEGAGKDSFLDFFTNHVLGAEFAQSFNQVDDLSKKFNKNAEKCIITLLSEIGGNGAAYKKHNLLKDITTRKYQNIERKGIDGYRARDCNNYWMFSNDDWIVKINETDRRHICLNVNTVYVGDEEYFNCLHEHSTLEIGMHFLL
jgi:hypothetical protein